MPAYALLFLVGAAISILAWWRIFTRLGWPPMLAVLMAIPVANLATLVYIAFTPWPIEQRFLSLKNDLMRMRGEM